MKILFAAIECAPFFKVGGLADVAGALPKELKKQGVDIRVVLPLHTVMPTKYKDQLETVAEFNVKVGWRMQYCGIKQLVLDDIIYYFVDNLYYFERPKLYGYYEDGERYAFFSHAIIEMMQHVDFIPDIVHVNDYHTAMVPVLLKEKYSWIEAYKNIRTVLTIHNLEFQGQYGVSMIGELFGLPLSLYEDGRLAHSGAFNWLKAGIIYADKITTVSPSYAQEIQTPAFGHGLDGLLREHSYKLSGIVNGIDVEKFDPETDEHLVFNYNYRNRLKGKLNNKLALQERLGLTVSKETPLLGFVGRLTPQKGCNLIVSKVEEILSWDVQIVILGTGFPEIENSIRYFDYTHHDKFRGIVDFDLELAQQIYAASDMFLMPSGFEPCGLSQMIAMRYGSVPIVHEIGGLKDTVIPFNYETEIGTGFGFKDFTPDVFRDTVGRANAMYRDDPKMWKKILRIAMEQDFSWDSSTKEYIELYNSLLE